jgi:sRNA-binding regulator protein Hfq
MHKWNRRRFSQHRSRDGIAEMVQRAHRVEEQTNAEAVYLARLIQNKTPITVKLVNEEEISGWIEYYDRNFIRVTRHNAPNAFIYKDQIKFITESYRK